MNRLMIRSRIWLLLALVLPVLVALIGVLLFQVLCSFWCRQVSIVGVVGFQESAIVACCASTVIVGLGYLMFWQRSIVAAHQRTHTPWLVGGALIMFMAIIPIAMILAPLFPGQIGIFGNLPLFSLIVLISWSVAVVVGVLLRISLMQAWALSPSMYPLWARDFAGSWNWGWLIICVGNVLALFIGSVIGTILQSPIPLVVGWIVFWCLGWWKIGIPIGLWLQEEVLPTAHKEPGSDSRPASPQNMP